MKTVTNIKSYFGFYVSGKGEIRTCGNFKKRSYVILTFNIGKKGVGEGFGERASS